MGSLQQMSYPQVTHRKLELKNLELKCWEILHNYPWGITSNVVLQGYFHFSQIRASERLLLWH